MTRLQFEFQEMANEVDAIAGLAEPFLDDKSRLVLPNLRRSLETYRAQPTVQPTDWIISSDNPLLTTLSEGQYEVGGGGGLSIYGEITAKWQIQRVPPKKRSQRAELFCLTGIASTRIRLLCPDANGGAPSQVAMWRMEIGDAAAPGCHFHVQILGETANYPFPSSVPVPRFAGLLLTPAAAVEYVLAELFQDEWPKHMAHSPAHLQRWIPIQRRRFNNLLNWHIETLGRGGSPWTTLKRAKPQENLFLAERLG